MRNKLLDGILDGLLTYFLVDPPDDPLGDIPHGPFNALLGGLPDDIPNGILHDTLGDILDDLVDDILVDLLVPLRNGFRIDLLNDPSGLSACQ